MKIEFGKEKLKRKSICNGGSRIFIESNKKLIGKTSPIEWVKGRTEY